MPGSNSSARSDACQKSPVVVMPYSRRRRRGTVRERWDQRASAAVRVRYPTAAPWGLREPPAQRARSNDEGRRRGGERERPGRELKRGDDAARPEDRHRDRRLVLPPLAAHHRHPTRPYAASAAANASGVVTVASVHAGSPRPGPAAPLLVARGPAVPYPPRWPARHDVEPGHAHPRCPAACPVQEGHTSLVPHPEPVGQPGDRRKVVERGCDVRPHGHGPVRAGHAPEGRRGNGPTREAQGGPGRRIDPVPAPRTALQEPSSNQFGEQPVRRGDGQLRRTGPRRSPTERTAATARRMAATRAATDRAPAG